MNPDFPQDERAKVEAKLTALLLGELHADEVAELSQAMEKDPELAALYERLKFTVELVREGTVNSAAQAGGQAAPLKLSSERREKLLASFKTVTPAAFARPRRVMDLLMPWAAVAVITVFFVSIAIPNFIRTRETGRKNTIVNNLRLLDGAKEQWALEKGKSGDDVPTMADLGPYLGRVGGTTTIASVAGETYVFGKVSDVPKVEASVSQAKKLFGREMVAEAEVRDGKVIVSPLGTPPAAPGATVVLPGGAKGASENKPRDLSRLAIVYSASSDVREALKKLEERSTNSWEGYESYSASLRTASQSETPQAMPAPIIVPPSQTNNAGTFALQSERTFGPNQLLWGAKVAGNVPVGGVDTGTEVGTLKQDAFFLRGATATNAVETLNLGDSYTPSTSYRMLSQLGTESDKEKLNINYTNSTVLSSSSSQTLSKYVDTSVQWNFGVGNQGGQSAATPSRLAIDASPKSDKVPFLGDVPIVGSLPAMKPNMAGAAGNFETALTRDDVSGLRYMYTNGAVASQPVSGDALAFDDFRPGLAGASTFGGGTVANSSRFAVIGPAPAGGSIQGDGRRSEIVLPPAAVGEQEQMLALGDLNIAQNGVKSTVDSMEISGGFGGGGGGGSTAAPKARRAVGGKQVEIAAAATPPKQTPPIPEVSVGAKFVDVEESSNDSSRALAYQWYAGNKFVTNGSIVASGGTTPAAAPLTAAPQPNSSSTNQAGGLRYVTGLDSTTEIQTATRNYLLSKGVDLNSGEGKSVFFNDRNGTLTVRGTEEDLKKVQAAVDALNAPKPVGADSSVTDVSFGEPTTGAPAQFAAAAGSAGKTAPYFAAKEELDNAKRWRQVLSMKTEQEKVEVNLPKARMVAIMDTATAAAPDKSSFGKKLKETLTGKVERTARVQIEQEHPDINGVGSMGNLGAAYDPYFLLTEFETIQSDAVLKKAVEKLNLDGGDKSKTEEAVKQLKNNLDLGVVKNTKFIEIGARSKKAEDAARIANAVAEAYRDYRAEEYDDLKNHGINSLKQQLQEQDQKIASLQSNVEKLRGDLNIPDSVANASNLGELMTVDRVRELSSLRVQKEADYNQQATLLEGLKQMDHQSLRRALPIAYSDPQLNSLLSELDLAQQALIKLKTDYAPENPKYKNAAESVNDLNRKIDERVGGIMAGLDGKVASEKAFLDTLNHEMQQMQPADAAPPKVTLPPLTPQPEILTRENSFSTFSLNVSDVSFKLAAASLTQGQMPEPASIRSEEFINAFDYRDPDARDGAPIAFASERARYPFAQNRELLRFSLKTAAAGRQAGRPLNIVLLLDNSGSMERADRVRIIQEAMRVLAGQLQASDTFSIVTFARTAQLRVDGIPGNQAAAAASEIAKLTPEGGTNLGDALELAYQTALHHYLANGDNRVVLLTDGAANLGDVKPEVLKQKVEAHRQQGVALDCFGIGWEGYNDDLLEVLTRNGDGRYGFINTPEEANTEFVAQIAGALHVAASDVKVQVEFNPKRVVSYRQIGYAKHQLTKEQFRDNTVDAAEIAAQEAGNALYTTEIDPQGEGSIATVRVRYKVPGTAEYREQAWDVPYTGGAVALDQATPAMRLAATTSAFSEWLATSPFAAEVSTDQLLNYLSGVPQVYGADTRPAKLEWMIRQARSISGK